MAIPKKAVANQRKIRETKKQSNEIPDGFKRDPKTGKTYRVIPKIDIDKNGFSDVVVDGLAGIRGDPLDTAEQFLGHLRVAPTADELAELRADKLKQAREQRLARDQQDKEGGDDS